MSNTELANRLRERADLISDEAYEIDPGFKFSGFEDPPSVPTILRMAAHKLRMAAETIEAQDKTKTTIKWRNIK